MGMSPRSRRHRSGTRRPWPDSSAPRPPRRRPSNPPKTPAPAHPAGDPADGADGVGSLEEALARFTESWDRGEAPRAEGYVAGLRFEDESGLIYHEYCLAEASALDPDPADFLRRFPEHADALGRLFSMHGAVSASELARWVDPPDLPEGGDEIGPYRLIRELGRGAFARVFLAEQADLGHRLVVVKVSTRPSAEPTLLGRVRHPHIVEVLRQADADDGALHLVCMPFLGGATLGALLEGRRRIGRKARSGDDLLADLDRASAPEYPPSGLVRPAREILAGLSHAGALAWIVARLAEALDHAHRRGVTHGDLKPSNILLTAEGTPMLFDFNLAVDWHGPEAGGLPADAGGTLAYMAPERLRAIAGPSEARPVRPADRHRADLYALGLVLLEALTGRPPEVPRARFADPRGLAAALAERRLGPPGGLLGREAAAIPPALRSILARCLAPDPADRHARGDELAEDLDRWRDDRPLTFADESRLSALSRRVRRRRATVIAAGLTLITAVAVGLGASIVISGTRRDRALARLSTIFDRSQSGVFAIRKATDWNSSRSEDPAEASARYLALYGVATDPDWRDRDDVRSLPDRDREELEAWLSEQVLRLAIALGERPDSPADWRRALTLLDQAIARAPLAAFGAQRLVLLDKLRLPPIGPGAGAPGVPAAPRWLDDYLAGVAAEPLHAREALGHFHDALRGRPDLFWAHYRAALAASRVDEHLVAADHLQRCVGRRPDNPSLRVLLAATIYQAESVGASGRRLDPDGTPGRRLDPLSDALRHCDRAVALDPDLTAAYRVRAKLREAAGFVDGVEADIGRFALLTRSRGRAEEASLRLGFKLPGPNYRGYSEEEEVRARRLLADRPDDLDTRTYLAIILAQADRTSEALEHLDGVLESDPGHLRARNLRAAALRRVDPKAGLEEYRAVIANPRFEELFYGQPTAIRAFHQVATDLFERGQIDEALEVARMSQVHARRSASLRADTLLVRSKSSIPPGFDAQGETSYLLARINAAAVKSGRGQIDEVADHLAASFSRDPLFRDVWFARDRLFDGLRDDLADRLKAREAGR